MIIRKRFAPLVGLAMLLILLVAMPIKAKISAENIQWMGYEEGMALSKAENKRVLLHFWADWCQYCEQMAQETLADKRVIAYLNENYIAIKVNFDIERQQVSKYSVRGLPNTYFLEPDGEVISNLPGFIQADLFFDILKYLHTDSHETMSFQKFQSRK